MTNLIAEKIERTESSMDIIDNLHWYWSDNDQFKVHQISTESDDDNALISEEVIEKTLTMSVPKYYSSDLKKILISLGAEDLSCFFILTKGESNLGFNGWSMVKDQRLKAKLMTEFTYLKMPESIKGLTYKDKDGNLILTSKTSTNLSIVLNYIMTKTPDMKSEVFASTGIPSGNGSHDGFHSCIWSSNLEIMPGFIDNNNLNTPTELYYQKSISSELRMVQSVINNDLFIMNIIPRSSAMFQYWTRCYIASIYQKSIRGIRVILPNMISSMPSGVYILSNQLKSEFKYDKDEFLEFTDSLGILNKVNPIEYMTKQHTNMLTWLELETNEGKVKNIVMNTNIESILTNKTGISSFNIKSKKKGLDDLNIKIFRFRQLNKSNLNTWELITILEIKELIIVFKWISPVRFHWVNFYHLNMIFEETSLPFCFMIGRGFSQAKCTEHVLEPMTNLIIYKIIRLFKTASELNLNYDKNFINLLRDRDNSNELENWAIINNDILRPEQLYNIYEELGICKWNDLSLKINEHFKSWVDVMLSNRGMHSINGNLSDIYNYSHGHRYDDLKSLISPDKGFIIKYLDLITKINIALEKIIKISLIPSEIDSKLEFCQMLILSSCIVSSQDGFPLRAKELAICGDAHLTKWLAEVVTIDLEGNGKNYQDVRNKITSNENLSFCWDKLCNETDDITLSMRLPIVQSGLPNSNHKAMSMEALIWITLVLVGDNAFNRLMRFIIDCTSLKFNQNPFSFSRKEKYNLLT